MRPLLPLCLTAVLLCASAPGFAQEEPSTQSSTPNRGRPTVKLDRLTVPAVHNQDAIERHLRDVLHREARRADWGAGRGALIEYRFRIEKLTLDYHKDVVSIACTASGALPRGKAAKSRLVFGGKASEKDKLLNHVLDIVARGVIARLAELERERRGED